MKINLNGYNLSELDEDISEELNKKVIKEKQKSNMHKTTKRMVRK
jgi:hypothetical protein